ncbi:MAG: hypothetical protein V4736_11820, partial [Bdellovibrionota bacterium]
MKILKSVGLIAFLFVSTAFGQSCPTDSSTLSSFNNACGGAAVDACPLYGFTNVGLVFFMNTGSTTEGFFTCRGTSCSGGTVYSGATGYSLKTCGTQSPHLSTTRNPEVRRPVPSCGSIILLDNRVLGEEIPLIGANFSLHYFSNRVNGASGKNIIDIPITGASVDSTIASVQIQIYDEVNSLLQTQTYTSPSSDITHSYTWNGLDSNSDVPIGPLRFRTKTIESLTIGTVTLSVENFISVGAYKAMHAGLGGWLPSVYHYYDKVGETLFRGDGTSRKVGHVVLGSGNLQVPEEDGSLVYEFDPDGIHVETQSGLKGTTLYTFGYTSDGLSTITEPFSRVTTFTRDMSGELTSITTPSGKVMTVTLDTNGYLATLTNSVSEDYTMTYSSSGLLLTFEKPNGNIGTFTYDTHGRLNSDINNSGSATYIEALINSTYPEIAGFSVSSDMSRMTTIEHIPSALTGGFGSDEQRTTLPNGKIQRRSMKPESANAEDGYDGSLYYASSTT